MTGAQGAAAVVGDDFQQGLQQGQVVTVGTLRQLTAGNVLTSGYAERRIGLTVRTCELKIFSFNSAKIDFTVI